MHPLGPTVSCGKGVDGTEKSKGSRGKVSAILLSQKLGPCQIQASCPSIHPSIHLFIHPPIHPAVHLSIHPLNIQETGPCLRPSVRSWADMRRVIGFLPSAFLCYLSRWDSDSFHLYFSIPAVLLIGLVQ